MKHKKVLIISMIIFILLAISGFADRELWRGISATLISAALICIYIKLSQKHKELMETSSEYRVAHNQKLEAAKKNKALKEDEHLIFLPGLALRKDKNGYYYFGELNGSAEKYRLIDFRWNGPEYVSNSTTFTTGTEKTKGKVKGGIIRNSRLKSKTTSSKIDHTFSRAKEVDTAATLVFESVKTDTKVFKNIKCNQKVAKKIEALSFHK